MRKLWFIVLFLAVTLLAGYTLPALAGAEGQNLPILCEHFGLCW